MNLKDDYVLSAERYEKYDDKQENRRWKEWLETKIADGEMTKGMLVMVPRDCFELKALIVTT